MKSDMMKANQGAANWFNKDIFYALIAPTFASRLGLTVFVLAQLTIVVLMLKQMNVGGVLMFWCLLSTLVSAGLIRPLLQRFEQAHSLRLQPYFYRHFVVVLTLIAAVFALLPLTLFLLQYQAYNLISIWLVSVSGALAGMWVNDDWQQENVMN
ncbi:hypothetical protein K6Y31_07225 [Motilimonas cestriensis]|uniref:Uncharacterized protein n=1 Tax=Motilimonas cestriensis TaxID=2742685 RepID=A0ABS8WA63_9GAMM|nr:hypothetical protein [Motilimonas cestriensis]MCE2594603.1 hypothetical protein [Motilimonas cestriensis]